jgi:Protein of unknown function (DUF732)
LETVRAGIANVAVALVSAAVAPIATVVCAGVASADPSQQDQFVELLEADQVPMVDNLPALVARAKEICHELDSGKSVYAVLDEEMNMMFDDNPAFRQDAGRVHRTAIRFIAVSSEVYCPKHLTDPYMSDDVGFSTRVPAFGAPRQA